MTTLLDLTTVAVDVGPAVEAGPLRLFPVRLDAAPAAPYVCSPDAEAAGLLHVGELADGATVPELLVLAGTSLPLLLIEGETILGVQQNRTLNVSVLCPAGVETKVPVSCVEAGRWGAPQPTSRSAHHSPPLLRARKTRSVSESMRLGMRHSDQGLVWDTVAEYAAAVPAACSATSAMEDIARTAMPDAAGLIGGLRPAAGQCGVVVAAGGTLTLDLFDKPETLAAYWDGLLAGYALDALSTPAATVTDDDAAAFVSRALSASASSAPGVGLGVECHLDGNDGVSGTALVWDGALVHLAAFAHGRPARRAVRPIRRSR